VFGYVVWRTPILRESASDSMWVAWKLAGSDEGGLEIHAGQVRGLGAIVTWPQAFRAALRRFRTPFLSVVGFDLSPGRRSAPSLPVRGYRGGVSPPNGRDDVTPHGIAGPSYFHDVEAH